MNEELESSENLESDVDNWNGGDENLENVSETPKKQDKKADSQTSPQTQQDSKKDLLDDLSSATPYHLRDGLANQNAILMRLVQRGDNLKEELKSDDNINEVMLANLNDFLTETNNLEKEVQRLQDFFNKDLSLRDRQFVDKARLFDVEIQNINKDLKEFLLQNNEIRDFISDMQSHIDNIKKQSDNAIKINDTTIEEIKEIKNSLGFINQSLSQFKNHLHEKLEAEMTDRVESLSELVSEFYNVKNEQKEAFVAGFKSSFENAQNEIVKKITNTDKSITNMLENAKKMVFGILAILVFAGIALGAFSGLAYSKYSQYKDIESSLNKISSQLNGIKVLKNKQNNIVLVVPKDAKIESYGNEYTINLGANK